LAKKKFLTHVSDPKIQIKHGDLELEAVNCSGIFCWR